MSELFALPLRIGPDELHHSRLKMLLRWLLRMSAAYWVLRLNLNTAQLLPTVNLHQRGLSRASDSAPAKAASKSDVRAMEASGLIPCCVDREQDIDCVFVVNAPGTTAVGSKLLPK
mgnify:FL=1